MMTSDNNSSDSSSDLYSLLKSSDDYIPTAFDSTNSSNENDKVQHPPQQTGLP